MAALAALADSPTVIRGVAHIRGHETDRLAALARELGALGAVVTETEDGLRIEPRPLQPRPVPHLRRPPHGDGRRGARAAAPGLVVEDVGTVAKTLPDFTRAVARTWSSPGTSAATA